MDGWIFYQSHFYYISSRKMNWYDSRKYCTDRRADLIIINNRDEHNFFKKMSCGAHVWIGLTDRHVEGRWKWVDGSNIGFRSWAQLSSSDQAATEIAREETGKDRKKRDMLLKEEKPDSIRERRDKWILCKDCREKARDSTGVRQTEREKQETPLNSVI
ncbi:hypothetical protein QQF64_002346 [Cirrhinus molitorella]|uniref:C-type lectin domain-containing protein n=1 Tax=Cirrhinus molitorella TaxID=172907 RepID=A0ABR3MPV1_9TELE